jgi:uncharacterized protein YcfL
MINPRFMTGLLCTAFLIGCGSVNTYRATVGEADGKAAYTSQINDVLSSFFLKAESVRFARTDGGPYQVQVTVANDGFSYRNFAYRFEWLDADGMIMPSGSTWQSAAIPSGASSVISSVAPNDSARTFQLQVRRTN